MNNCQNTCNTWAQHFFSMYSLKQDITHKNHKEWHMFCLPQQAKVKLILKEKSVWIIQCATIILGYLVDIIGTIDWDASGKQAFSCMCLGENACIAFFGVWQWIQRARGFREIHTGCFADSHSTIFSIEVGHFSITRESRKMLFLKGQDPLFFNQPCNNKINIELFYWCLTFGMPIHLTNHLLLIPK